MPLDNPQVFWNMNIKFHFDHDGVPMLLAPGTEPQRGLYNRRVSRVAHQLRERLDQLKRPSASDGTFSGTTVFLARIEPNSSARTEWADIRALLVNDGATVVPDETENDFAAMASAHLFVQLFNPLDNLSIAKAQLKLAEARRIPILQWLKKLPNPKQHLLVLDGLDEEDKAFCQGADTGRLEQFKATIREQLNKIRDVPSPRTTIGGNRGRARPIEETHRKTGSETFEKTTIEHPRQRDIGQREQTERKAKTVFISYRREDTQYQASRCYNALCNATPSENVFMDIDSIQLGTDFVEILNGYLNRCDILLAFIGRNWAAATDPVSNRRRLENVDDFVRVEIREALKRAIPVVPVLFDRTPMPDPGQLPEDIRGLVRRQAEFVEFRTFDADVARLIKRLGLGQ
jgi:TIR domain